MSKKKQSTRNVLADHSLTKVNVFADYLRIYLNIMGVAPRVQRVHLFDTLCGEGQYDDGQYGSALVGLRRVLEYFSTYPSQTLRVAYTLNDGGESDVEEGKRKIDTVRERADRLPFQEYVNSGRLALSYSDREFSEVIDDVIGQIRRLSPHTEKALVFIDPWGYKDVQLTKLRDVMAGGQSEILLFLPTENMYRFARKAYHEEFSGGAPLQALLTELFPDALPASVGVHDFINRFRLALQDHLGAKYSSRFTLETKDHNTYALFYFTSSLKGLQKMVEVQWKQDKDAGTGHRADRAYKLFPLDILGDYGVQVTNFLASAPTRTNSELLEFTVQQGYLPRHTDSELKRLFTEGRLQMEALDGKPLMKGKFYTSNEERRVRCSLSPQS